MEKDRTKNINDKCKCWVCKRNNEDLKNDIPNFHIKDEGIRWTDVSDRSMFICGICEDIISGIVISTNSDLKGEYQEDILRRLSGFIINGLEDGLP